MNPNLLYKIALKKYDEEGKAEKLHEYIQSLSRDVTLYETQVWTGIEILDYLLTQEGRKLPVKHCIRQTEGWQIIPELKAYTSDAKIIEKPTFGSVELAKELMNADQITLIGLCTDICVISNALLLKAYYPEKMIQVDVSCCAGVTPRSHENAVSAMKMCQIDIIGEQNKKGEL